MLISASLTSGVLISEIIISIFYQGGDSQYHGHCEDSCEDSCADSCACV